MKDLTLGFLVILLVLGGIVGWIMNIVKLSVLCCDLSGMLVLRTLGVLMPPLGAIIGWI